MTFDDLLCATGQRFGLRVRRLRGQERHSPIARPRMIAMYLGRKLLGMSYPAIGRQLGGRNHSTVIVDVRKIEKLLGAGDRALAEAIASICAALDASVPEFPGYGLQLPTSEVRV